MRARDVVGKRIVSVTQARIWNRYLSAWETAVGEIVLDDGTRLVLDAQQDEDDLHVGVIVVLPDNRRRRSRHG